MNNKNSAILATISFKPEGKREIGYVCMNKQNQFLRFTNENINDENLKPVTIIALSDDDYDVAVKKLNLSGSFEKIDNKLVIGIPMKNTLDSVITGRFKVGTYVQSFRNDKGMASCIKADYLNTNTSSKVLVGILSDCLNTSDTEMTAQDLANKFDQKLRDKRVRLLV